MISISRKFHERALQILKAIEHFDNQQINQDADSLTASLRSNFDQASFLSHQATISLMARERMRSIYQKHMSSLIKF